MPKPYDTRIVQAPGPVEGGDQLRASFPGPVVAIETFYPCGCPDCPSGGHWRLSADRGWFLTPEEAAKAIDMGLSGRGPDTFYAESVSQ